MNWNFHPLQILVALSLILSISFPSKSPEIVTPPNLRSIYSSSSEGTTLPQATAIAAGYRHDCAIVTGGGVECWGGNPLGEIGDGTTINRSTPEDIPDLTWGVSAISAGWDTTCALMKTGIVKCWGYNAYGELGDGTTSFDRLTPVVVVGLSGVAAITSGFDHTCALTTAGGVKCWGANGGRLGDGTPNNSSTPVQVVGLTSGVIAIAAGGVYTCALTTGGGVKCWGSVGNDSDFHLTPVDVAGLTSGVSAIAAGGRSMCVLTTEGGVKCWGNNVYGQLGDGTTNNSTTPVQVVGLTSGVTAIDAGWDHACVLTIEGGIKCWGYNHGGQLGDDTTINSSTPVPVVGLTSGVSAIAAGGYQTCAMIAVGGVKCWGANSEGALGDGTTNDSPTPVDVVGFKNFNVPSFYQGYPSTPLSVIPVKSQVPWYYDFYGDPLYADDSLTMGEVGCNTTANAMIINYYAQLINSSFRTDPGLLNTWLRENSGYDKDSYVIYLAVTTYAMLRGIPLAIQPGSNDDKSIQNALDQGNPVMLQVSGTHWVVATGTSIFNGQSTYVINDPIWGRTLLSAHYSGHTAAVYYGLFTVNTDESAIQLTVYSPVHIIVTDPQGRKEGFDPRNNTNWDEIPNAAYMIDSIYNPDGNPLPETKLLYIPQPLSGDYSIEVIGYDNGSYEIDLTQTTLTNATTKKTYSGFAENASVDNITFKYMPFSLYLPLLRK